MVKIGVVNIDVSHPKVFAEYYLRSNRAKYTAIYNDGFREKDEVDAFVEKNQLEKICTSVEELADSVDIGFIQGCNWDKHLAYAKPFFDRNKPVFIDKPMVGNLKDCETLRSLSKEGKVILGSSSLRYCDEVQNFLNINPAERGEVLQVSGYVGFDEFNYAIHGVEAISGLMGSGVKSVQHIGNSEYQNTRCRSFFIRYHDGRAAVYNSVLPHSVLFQLAVVTTKKSFCFTVDNSKIYWPMLDRIADYMETGENKLASVDDLVEAIEILFAAKASENNNKKEIFLSDLAKYPVSFDGQKFEDDYAAKAVKIYR